MEKVVWGVLSTAQIGIDLMLPAMRASPLIDLRAIASRSLEKAQRAAFALDIPRAYGSYDELIADPEIEAIYNPLPNHLHVPLTLQAAAAGKHVLCEKPIALTCERGRAAARRRRPRAHRRGVHGPPPSAVATRARTGARAAASARCARCRCSSRYFNDEPANIRNLAAIGGGALYDIGCYADLSPGATSSRANRCASIALVDRDPDFGTDRTTSALLDFGGGRHLTFTVSTQSSPLPTRQPVSARKARIEVADPVQRAAWRRDDASRVDGSGALDGSGMHERNLGPGRIITDCRPKPSRGRVRGDAAPRLRCGRRDRTTARDRRVVGARRRAGGGKPSPRDAAIMRAATDAPAMHGRCANLGAAACRCHAPWYSGKPPKPF